MTARIAVLGAGAIGSSLAADLAIAGHDPAVIDQWPAHVEALRARGVHVRTRESGYHSPVRAHHLCDVCNLHEPFDVVFLAAKSGDTRWMVELIRPRLAASGVVVGVQNGMNDAAIAAVVGAPQTIGCVVELSAELFTPGEVFRKTPPDRTWFALGELHGRITPRLEGLRRMLAAAGRVDLTTNITGAKWTKLVTSTMILTPFAMLGLQGYEALAEPEMFELCMRLGRETVAVGTALGHRLEPIFGLRHEDYRGTDDAFIEAIARTLVGHVGLGSRNTILQDHLKGRASETAHLNGLVAAHGRALGIPTPANCAVAAISGRIERGDLAPDRSNLALVRQWAGSAAG